MKAEPAALVQEPKPMLVPERGTDEELRDAFILVWVIHDETMKAAQKAAFNAVFDALGSLFGGKASVFAAILPVELLAAQPMSDPSNEIAIPLDLITGRRK